MQKIVCLGDSITFGYIDNPQNNNQVDIPYPSELQNILGERYQIINSGKPGWQARHVAKHLNELVFKHMPTKVILMLGINDARGSMHGFPVSKNSYYKSMHTIIDQLIDRDIDVLVLSPTPVYFPRVKAFNHMAIRVAKDMKVPYIDMHKQVYKQLEKDKLSLKQATTDKIHLTQDYYIKLAHIINHELHN